MKVEAIAPLKHQALSKLHSITTQRPTPFSFIVVLSLFLSSELIRIEYIQNAVETSCDVWM
jgi:hypothetical protein